MLFGKGGEVGCVNWRRDYIRLCYESADEITTWGNLERIILPCLRELRKGVLAAIHDCRRAGFRGRDPDMVAMVEECGEIRKAVCHAMRRIRDRDTAAVCNLAVEIGSVQ